MNQFEKAADGSNTRGYYTHDDALLQRLSHGLLQQGHLKCEQVHLTGIMVLYNNMLQRLFRSQILMLGLTVLLLTSMFLATGRHYRPAAQLTADHGHGGRHGWCGLPLDMMTITIAFGMLTALVMLIAMVTAQTLLPQRSNPGPRTVAI